MPPKHRRAAASAPLPPAKRPRPSGPAAADLLTPLSDELLLRILAWLSPAQLLHAVAPVARRFHRLVQDPQLWKALYYARFVLPRAMRIPRFRSSHADGPTAVARRRGARVKLHYKARRALWADGRLGGLVRREEEEAAAAAAAAAAGGAYPARKLRVARLGDDAGVTEDGVDWLRQFKIRHNWARGKCAVEELRLGPDPDSRQSTPNSEDEEEKTKMLVKVVEGLAATADAALGLRVWDLKTKEVTAQIHLRDEKNEDESAPSCMAIDDRGLDMGTLDIAVGFADGSFGVWRLGKDKSLTMQYRHEKSSNGELMGVAYSHPHLLTATGAVLVSLYTFDVPETPERGDEAETGSNLEDVPAPSRTTHPGPHGTPVKCPQPNATSLPAPYLMTSLKSHTSDPPLVLSIRRTGNITVASIAYTFFTRQGWSIGIQDLHITPNTNPKRTPSITTRLAYTAPVQTGSPRVQGASPPPAPVMSHLSSSTQAPSPPSSPPGHALQPPAQHRTAAHAGPTTLSYTHPYLLATLPDNTLLLHLCTSSAAALAISPGIRLWGHTSGISDAEITARGKAVSVSSRGGEMRVWELEGGVRSASGARGRSVEIRPGAGGGPARERKPAYGGKGAGTGGGGPAAAAAAAAAAAGGVVDWEARRNWVGFDDEMVIVLKEAKGGRESLLVYDFT